MLKGFGDFNFDFDMKKYMQGFYQSSMLAGAYSGYNPVIMYYAGLMGGFNSCIDKK
jgi:hypothetical protein